MQIAVALGQPSPSWRGPADLVTALGAHHVIDYTRDDFADGFHTYDVVVDTGGMTSVSRLRRTLEPKGTLVIVAARAAARGAPAWVAS